MSWTEFMETARLYRKEQRWPDLESLLREPHPLYPGELEVFLVLLKHEKELGHKPCVRLDATGVHVEPIH